MNEEFEVLKIVVERLNKSDMLYMISGSIALNYYSIPRMTRDIDIVVELKGKNLDKFINIFKNDFYLDKKTIKEEINRKGIFNLIHNKHIVKIDFIIKQDSEYQKISFLRRKIVKIEDVNLWLISPEDLIISKLNWAKNSYSELQLEDVKNLMDSVNNLDISYIENWILKLNLDKIYNKIKNERY